MSAPRNSGRSRRPPETHLRHRVGLTGVTTDDPNLMAAAWTMVLSRRYGFSPGVDRVEILPFTWEDNPALPHLALPEPPRRKRRGSAHTTGPVGRLLDCLEKFPVPESFRDDVRAAAASLGHRLTETPVPAPAPFGVDDFERLSAADRRLAEVLDRRPRGLLVYATAAGRDDLLCAVGVLAARPGTLVLAGPDGPAAGEFAAWMAAGGTPYHVLPAGRLGRGAGSAARPNPTRLARPGARPAPLPHPGDGPCVSEPGRCGDDDWQYGRRVLVAADAGHAAGADLLRVLAGSGRAYGLIRDFDRLPLREKTRLLRAFGDPIFDARDCTPAPRD